MKKESKFRDLGAPPTPTPEQLDNSIAALKGINPSDSRIKKYEGMRPKAEDLYEKWIKSGGGTKRERLDYINSQNNDRGSS